MIFCRVQVWNLCWPISHLDILPWSQALVFFTVCFEKPSCWNMNSPSNNSQEDGSIWFESILTYLGEVNVSSIT